MAKRVLTDKFLRALKPAPTGKQITIWDATQANFGVRVTDKADVDGRARTLSFVVWRRRPGQQIPERTLLGHYLRKAPDGDHVPVRGGQLTLAEARVMARDVLATVVAGKRIADVEAEARRAEERKRRDTFARAVEAYAADHKALRTARATEAVLRRSSPPGTPARLQRSANATLLVGSTRLSGAAVSTRQGIR